MKTSGRLNIVLDTNFLLVCLSRKSKYRPIFDALLSEKFDLSISQDILLEYEEIIQRKTNSIVASNIIDALLSLPNVFLTEVFFHWNIITEDPSDNKFIDCFIASGAELFVTNDSHFEVLKKTEFPNITMVNIRKFLQMLENQASVR